MSSSTTQAPFSPSEQLANKNILLSGTTGFLGKVVLSMLLCRFPKIGKIYTLIRPGISEKAEVIVPHDPDNTGVHARAPGDRSVR